MSNTSQYFTYFTENSVEYLIYFTYGIFFINNFGIFSINTFGIFYINTKLNQIPKMYYKYIICKENNLIRISITTT